MADKKNNFGAKTDSVSSVKKDSMLRYRSSLDPLEQSDEFASQDRWGATSQQKGITTNPYIRGRLAFISAEGQIAGIIESTPNNSIIIDPTIAEVNFTNTQLDGAINASVTTITVDSTEGFELVGPVYRFLIDSEIIWASGKTATTFTGCSRGSEGTTAASHSNNAPVTQMPGGIQLGLAFEVISDGVGGVFLPFVDNMMDIGAPDYALRAIYVNTMRAITLETGNITPFTSNTYDIGTTLLRYQDIYTINLDVASAIITSQITTGDIISASSTADIGSSTTGFDNFFIQDIFFSSTSSNPTTDGQLRFFDSGGTEQLRVQFGGSDFSLDATAV